MFRQVRGAVKRFRALIDLTCSKLYGVLKPMRSAVCNELFGATKLEKSCEIIAAAGFDGIEIAPFTCAHETGVPDPASRREIRHCLARTGLAFAGLHWLLARPTGLHITSSDPEVRRRSWDHMRALLELAGELGGGPLALGSPGQRSYRDGTLDMAVGRLVEGLAGLADFAAACGSRLLVEALPSRVTNLVNTLAEARRIAEAVAHPAVGIMFDFHNVEDEMASVEELISEHGSSFGHVHVNLDDGGPPGEADAPAFAPAFDALHETGYEGWVSLEIFEEPADPARTLRSVRAFLHAAGAA